MSSCLNSMDSYFSHPMLKIQADTIKNNIYEKQDWKGRLSPRLLNK
jgi:hypothetical protein